MKEWKQSSLLAAGLVHAVSSVVWAQDPARLTEPEGTAITWVIGGALLVVVSVTAFINPKRSHRP